MTNDQKISNAKKRRILFYLIIFFGISTLVLAILSLVIKFTPIPAIITFLIEFLLTKYRERIAIK